MTVGMDFLIMSIILFVARCHGCEVFWSAWAASPNISVGWPRSHPANYETTFTDVTAAR